MAVLKGSQEAVRQAQDTYLDSLASFGVTDKRTIAAFAAWTQTQVEWSGVGFYLKPSKVHGTVGGYRLA